MEKNKLQHHNITTDTLFDDIRNIIEQGRQQAYAAANQITVLTYWHIGRRIVEEEQHGEARAQYGTRLIKTLAEQLMPKYGNTFSKRNLDYFRQFYLCFSDLEIVNTRVHNLTWSHFRSIIQVADPKAREWYVKEASEQMWSVRILNRNIGTQYYGRRMACVREGLTLPAPDVEANDPLEYIKNPVVAEFLGFRKDCKYDESQLEQALIDHLQQFIMELGRGFAFVDRQKHISTDTGDFYIDLVFYNIKLKRYVLLELLKHKYPMQEIGPYIQECDERNTDLNIKLSQGIANTKVFQSPKQVALNSKSDKIVRTGQFGYNRATTRNGEKISIAYRLGADCTVSSAYCVFKITHEEILDPYFLWMWVARPEFDRYARYMSKGSAHEFFEFDEMCRVKIPLPPIDIQQAIVNIYKCANEAKQIAEEADRLSREVCPALLQHVIHS